MKQSILKPGFECVFALSLAAIVGLPPLVMGQDKQENDYQKQITVKMKGSDTMVNSKRIKDMPATGRDEVSEDILVDTRTFTLKPQPDEKRRRFVIKRKPHGEKSDILIDRRALDRDEMPGHEMEEGVMINDSLGKKLGLKLKVLREAPGLAFNNGLTDDHSIDSDGSLNDVTRVRGFRLGRTFDNLVKPNSQSFNYTSTDADGISTHVSYRINAASAEKLKMIAGVNTATLQLKDIHISPEFSTGKTTLTFNLPAKTAAEVQFKDSQGKLLWSDKAVNGAFSKTFVLGLNGAYYLQVKQGMDIAVKRVVKED
ncbi:T9SS type A sorting domain-containing protein [Mucilaginibacter hurinus]|nr:T9SS type A sorting domain-containing protein [Mucilaginibacter hurinus]